MGNVKISKKHIDDSVINDSYPYNEITMSFCGKKIRCEETFGVAGLFEHPVDPNQPRHTWDIFGDINGHKYEDIVAAATFLLAAKGDRDQTIEWLNEYDEWDDDEERDNAIKAVSFFD